jgi:hypothetical protein
LSIDTVTNPIVEKTNRVLSGFNQTISTEGVFCISRVLRRIEMSMIKEFKEFEMRGNVLDMAVGIIVGAAW